MTVKITLLCWVTPDILFLLKINHKVSGYAHITNNTPFCISQGKIALAIQNVRLNVSGNIAITCLIHTKHIPHQDKYEYY